MTTLLARLRTQLTGTTRAKTRTAEAFYTRWRSERDRAATPQHAREIDAIFARGHDHHSHR